MSKGFAPIQLLLIGAIILGTWGVLNYDTEPNVGAFGDAFVSLQVGASPVNTYVLQTDGTDSTWVDPSVIGGGGGSADHTYPFPAAATTTNLSFSGGMTFSGAASNINLGSNWLSNDGNDTGITIDGDDEVGINIAAPSGQLHVYEDSSFTGTLGGIQMEQDGAGDSRIIFELTGDQSFVAGVDNTDNSFKITPGAALQTGTALTINPAGNVGVVDDSPTYNLDVTGQIRATDLVDASHFIATSTSATSTFAGGVAVNSGASSYLDIYKGAASEGALEFRRLDESLDASISVNANEAFLIDYNQDDTSDNLIFRSGTALTNIMTLLSGGNVGIGDTTPDAALEVLNTTAPQVTITHTDGVDDLDIGVTSDGYAFLNSTGNRIGLDDVTPNAPVDIFGELYLGGIDDMFANHGNTEGAWLVGDSGRREIMLGIRNNGATSTGIYMYDENDSDANDLLQFFAGDSVRMSITPSGDVGIGDTAPDAKLDINTTKNALAAVDTPTNYHLILQGNSDTTGHGTGLGFGRSTGGSLGASIIHERQGSNSFGDLLFFTKPDGGSLTERMVIDSAGNVGIGTTTPVTDLHISDSGDANLALSSNDGTEYMRFVAGSDANWIQSGIQQTAGSALPLKFASINAGSTWMTLDATGQLGIGTTSPSDLLSVDGDVSFSEGNNYRSFFWDATNGRLGLSEPTPDATLEVGDVGTDPVAIFDTDTDSNNFFITRIGELDQALEIGVSDSDVILESVQDENSGANGAFSFVIDDDSTASPSFKFRGKSGTEYARITETGFLGIGTSSPSNFLTVDASGNVQFAGLANCDTIDTNAQGVLACGTDSAGSGDHTYPFTVTGDGVASSTTFAFLNGIISNASSTFTSLLNGTEAIFSSYVDSSHVVATSTAATSTFAGGLTVGNDDLVVDPDGGFVGIGNSSPTRLLHLGDAGDDNVLLSFQDSDANESGIQFLLNDGSTVRGSITMDANEDIDIFGDEIAFETNGGDERMRIKDDATATVGIGTSSPTAVLEVRGDVRFAEGDKYNGFFYDATNGRLGLGISDPSTHLEVGSGAPESALITINGDGSFAKGVLIQRNSTEEAGFVLQSNEDLDIFNSRSGEPINLLTNGGGGATDRLTILGDGNVGIADATPTYTLDVSGLARITGLLDASYFTATTTAATSTFAGDLRFDGEILPDGLTCAVGQILKKAGYNDWDCAADATGGSGDHVFPFSITGDGVSTSTKVHFTNGFISNSSSTITDLNTTNATTTNATTTNLTLRSSNTGSDGVLRSLNILSEDAGDLQVGDGVGILFEIPYNGSLIGRIGAAIDAIKTSATDSDSSTALVFSTSQNDETLDEAMRIDENGRVGINDTTPDYRLEMTSTSGSGYFGVTNSVNGDIMQVDTNGDVQIGTTTAYGKFAVQDTGTTYVYVDGTGLLIKDGADADMGTIRIDAGNDNYGAFITGPTGSSFDIGWASGSTRKLTLGNTATGNSQFVFQSGSGNPFVGIGHEEPTVALNVQGETQSQFFTATSSSVTSTFATPPTFTTLTSALVLTGSGGLTAEYTGTTCTNQFARALSALGVATCETVDLTADVTGLLPSANIVDEYLFNNADDATTGSLTATEFVANDGAATSTFAGGLTVQTDALVVQDGDGAVGIGKINPQGVFDISIGEGLYFLGDNNYWGANNDARIIRMEDDNGTGGTVDGGLAIESYTVTDATAVTRLVVRGAGNVGIGNRYPAEKLNVQGEIAGQFFTATSTSATSTLPQLSGTVFSGFGLSACIGSANKLTWDDGEFRCETDQSGGAGDHTYPFTATGDGVASTTTFLFPTGGVVSTASSTFTNLNMVESTSTNFAITGVFHFFTEIWASLADFNTYVRSLFTGGVGVDISAGGDVTLDLSELGTETTMASGDFVAMEDITDNGSQKITLANFATSIDGVLDLANIGGSLDLTSQVTGVLPQANGGTASTTLKVWSVTIASTSPAFIEGGLLPIPPDFQAYTMSDIVCKVDGGTSKVVAIEDASANSTEDITCGTSPTQDDGSITNAAVTSLEEMYIDFGAGVGSVNYVTITVYK